jgi:hypothetical protein
MAEKVGLGMDPDSVARPSPSQLESERPPCKKSQQGEDSCTLHGMLFWVYFQDQSVEEEYLMERFTKARSFVITYCVGIVVLTAAHSIAFPEARAGDAVGIAANLGLLGIRLGLQLMTKHGSLEEHFAPTVFSYCWCTVVSLAVVGQAVAQCSGKTVMQDLDVPSTICLAAIWVLAVVYFNLIAIASTPRWLMLACVIVAHASFDPPASVLGRPYEGIVMGSAVLLGEALGQMLDRHLRLMFVRRHCLAERCGAGMASARGAQPRAESAPATVPSPWSSHRPPAVTQPTLVGTIWTRFHDPQLEAEFTLERFAAGCPLVIAAGFSSMLINAVHNAAFPEAFEGNSISLGMHALMVIYRLALQRMNDRALARKLFEGLLCALVVMVLFYMKAAQSASILGVQNRQGMLLSTGTWMLSFVYFTLVGITRQSRLFILAFVSFMHVFVYATLVRACARA